MRNKILLLISVFVIFMFLVSCVPQQQLTDEELKAELEKLTPEEREALVKDLESQKSGALSGQAIRAKTYAVKISPKVVQASPEVVKQAISKLAIVPQKVQAEAVFLPNGCGNGVCEEDESPTTCDKDCAVVYCGGNGSIAGAPYDDPTKQEYIFASYGSSNILYPTRNDPKLDVCLDQSRLVERYCDRTAKDGWNHKIVDCPSTCEVGVCKQYGVQLAD